MNLTQPWKKAAKPLFNDDWSPERRKENPVSGVTMGGSYGRREKGDGETNKKPRVVHLFSYTNGGASSEPCV